MLTEADKSWIDSLGININIGASFRKDSPWTVIRVVFSEKEGVTTRRNLERENPQKIFGHGLITRGDVSIHIITRLDGQLNQNPKKA